ncbi:unnamed protein product [Brassica oleracea]
MVYKLRCWERAGELLDAKPKQDIEERGRGLIASKGKLQTRGNALFL